MSSEEIVLTARCSSHHSCEHTIVCFASSHPRPVAQFLNSINVEYSFFKPSNLFFNCFFVRLSPDFCANLETTFFQPVVVKSPIGLLPAFISSLQASSKWFTKPSLQSALSPILELSKKNFRKYSTIHHISSRAEGIGPGEAGDLGTMDGDDGEQPRAAAGR